MPLIYPKCLCVGLFQFEFDFQGKGEEFVHRNEEHEYMLGPSVCSPKVVLGGDWL